MIRTRMKKQVKISTWLKVVVLIGMTITARAQEAQRPASNDAAELAKKLANPVASLISLPFQNNTDVGIGDHHGAKNTLNIQPVIPIKLSSKWNLIGRIVLPVITQYNVTGKESYQAGLSDAIVSGFISPAVAKNGLVWGAGPAFLVPTATDDLLGTKKFGVGPTALILKQASGWTVGALVNQIWSVAGDAERPEVNQMFLQPFLVHNWKSGAGVGLNAEYTQNWTAGNSQVFLNPSVSGVTKLGKQIISLSVGPRLQLAAFDGANADLGVRAVLTLVFPK